MYILLSCSRVLLGLNRVQFCWMLPATKRCSISNLVNLSFHYTNLRALQGGTQLGIRVRCGPTELLVDSSAVTAGSADGEVARAHAAGEASGAAIAAVTGCKVVGGRRDTDARECVRGG
jgi:hypothetical protein